MSFECHPRPLAAQPGDAHQSMAPRASGCRLPPGMVRGTIWGSRLGVGGSVLDAIAAMLSDVSPKLDSGQSAGSELVTADAMQPTG